MDEDKSCIFVPMWASCFGLLILRLIGCVNTADSPMKYNDLVFHSCPKDGHGDCPICCDPYKNENQEIIVLDR